MHLLIVTKSGTGAEKLIESLRTAGHAVTIAAASTDVARHIRELPLGAIVVESVRGPAAEEFRKRVGRVRPGCRVLFVSNLEGSEGQGRILSAGPGELVVHSDDLATLLDAPDAGAASAPADGEKVGTLAQALDVVVSLIESDDPYFAGYSHRVAELAGAIADRMDLGPNAREEVVIAALMHDLGKVAMGCEILKSAEKLGEIDVLKLREHVTWGERLIQHIQFPWRIGAIVRHHHERYDGSGYPEGLQGRAIPVGARIVSAADAYVAMRSHRRHRPALTEATAREELVRSSGSQLDPEVVEVLLKVVGERRTDASGGERPSVAVIDPDPSFQKLLRLRLVAEGMDVESRERIEEIETLLLGTRVSVLLVDAGRSGASNVEAARAAASAAGQFHVPLAVLASSDDRQQRLECMRQGVEDYIAKGDDLEEVVIRVKNILLRERRRAEPEPPPAREGLSGRLESMELAEIAQFLALGQKSARIQLTAAGEEGEVWMRAGAVVHATCGALTGEKAFFRMLPWREGAFHINHGIEASARTIEGDTTALLLEGMRLKDEASAGVGG